MYKIQEWANLIRSYEGWREGKIVNGKRIGGSLTWRLNNPGALRYSPFQDGTKGGFSYFETERKGMDALKYQLGIAVSGRSKVYRPTDTLLEFQRKYSPSSDGNDPIKYCKFIADGLGVNINTQIKDLA